MKKLIAILIVFAILTGVVFAQPSVGGQLQLGATLLEGNNVKDADINMGGVHVHVAQVAATFGDAQGGGKLVIRVFNQDGSAYGNPNYTNGLPWGFLYWRPSQYFRMQIGTNADGDYGAAKISGWGFTGEAKNSGAAISDYSDWGNKYALLYHHQSGSRPGAAFYPGTGDSINVNFTAYPTDLIRVNFVLPMADSQQGKNPGTLEFSEQISDFHTNVVVNLEGIGEANVSFVGRGGLAKEAKTSPGDVYGSFYLTALPNMGVELGLKYNIPGEDKSGGYMGLGLGFSFTMEALNIKLRTLAQVGGKDADGKTDQPTIINASLLPNYRINNDMIAFLYGGVSMWMEEISGKDRTTLGWFVNPYVWIRASEGLRFWTGVQVYQTGWHKDVEDLPFNWRIPFGFNFYF